MINLLPGERIDDLERNGYRIIQRSGTFCFGMDAVLLPDFAKAKENETVIDLGTGTGIIPILMAAKTEAKSLRAIQTIKNKRRNSNVLNFFGVWKAEITLRGSKYF